MLYSGLIEVIILNILVRGYKLDLHIDITNITRSPLGNSIPILLKIKNGV